MNDDQEKDLLEILATSKSLISTKYRKGAEEHKDTDPLFAKSVTELLDDALYEVTDLFVYLLTAKKSVMQIVKAIDEKYGPGTTGSGISDQTRAKNVRGLLVKTPDGAVQEASIQPTGSIQAE